MGATEHGLSVKRSVHEMAGCGVMLERIGLHFHPFGVVTMPDSGMFSKDGLGG
jgi:hypothetical protein